MLTGTYNLWLVLASLMIAMFASYTALDMAGRVSESRGARAQWWLYGGSCAMGIGIWSMHFIGMLAFSLPVPMGYDPLLTLLSLLIAVASSAFALYMVCKDSLSTRRLVFGAFLMGGGISTMHYMGMAAMEMQPGIQYIPSLFFLSIVVAVTASGAALWIAFHLRRRSAALLRLRVGASVVMGIAIAGMHYTGMAAAEFPKHSVCSMAETGLSSDRMAPLVIVFAFGALSIALLISMLDYRAHTLTSELDSAHRELQFMALHDGLTKLPNRILLEDRLAQEIENARRNRKRFSVFFLDLDGFKNVNDAYGHQIGDQLLVEVSVRLRSLVRGRDTVARIGGDEFIVLADAGEPGEAANLADKLIDGIQMPIEINGNTCNVSASIGITLYKCEENGPSNCEESGKTLLKQADAAMYHAKALGRNTYCFYEVSMNDDAQNQLRILHDLRLALPRNELVLHYQPKFDAKTNVMLGVEALIRWRHPERGIVAPGEFIPLAENIGLILPIGEWTIQEACRQMSEWQSMGHTGWTVAVNLSAVQFNHPCLTQIVRKALQDYNLNPASLVLEITETTAMRDPDVSLKILREIQSIGVRISIDDFGTGYSSLLYLKRLPAGELKIDRGFVREVNIGNEDAAIISAIVALGRSLNLEIVAEGVETVDQQNFLTSLGCDSLQGFLLGRPMPPDELIAAVAGASTRPEFHPDDPNRAPKLVAQLSTRSAA